MSQDPRVPDSSPDPTPEGIPDEDLVQRAQAGDADALNELFARHYQTMVEVARRKIGPRLRLKEDPDDLAQTTFREATRDFLSYQYQGEGSLLRWLIQILQNKIRDKAEFYGAGKRDLSRERKLEAPESEPDAPNPFQLSSTDLSVTQHVQRGEDYELLRHSLGELNSDYRKAITLVFFEGLSLREAGERLGGKSEDAVRMMLRRAEGKLGERLKASFCPGAS
jgi:RNA polymerase sigma-70 factor (subfamily 1)